MKNKEPHADGLSRREMMVAASMGALGAGVLGSCRMPGTKGQEAGEPLAQGDARITTKDGGRKPVYVVEEGVKDPLSFSIADTLFWTDILSEHATFFVMLMPGPELERPRSRAQEFQRTFTEHLNRTRGANLRQGEVVSFNRRTADLVKPFVEYKNEMREQQEAGKLQSLVWPLFFEHTAREAERFIKRLELFSKGTADLDRGEVVEFWTTIMADHADFIAHLLDPQEQTLVEKSMKTAKDFRKLRDTKPARNGKEDPVMKAADEIVDFKTAAAKGIDAGKIKSIINSALADHVRREAVKFVDELTRVSIG